MYPLRAKEQVRRSEISGEPGRTPLPSKVSEAPVSLEEAALVLDQRLCHSREHTPSAVVLGLAPANLWLFVI